MRPYDSPPIKPPAPKLPLYEFKYDTWVETVNYNGWEEYGYSQISSGRSYQRTDATGAHGRFKNSSKMDGPTIPIVVRAATETEAKDKIREMFGVEDSDTESGGGFYDKKREVVTRKYKLHGVEEVR